MSPRAKARASTAWSLGLSAWLIAAPIAGAQTSEATGASLGASSGVIEDYLKERGLNALLIVHLIDRMQASEGDERQRLAERLGELYGDALETATSDEAREHWQSESQKLLAVVPEAESFSLRLRLTKVAYLRAEDAAERHRMRLVDDSQLAQAKEAIHASAVTFLDIGKGVNRVVEALERREASGQDEDPTKLRETLAKMVSLRSIAMYYAGWACYYDAFLSGQASRIEDSLRAFGWLLNASGGREASTSRVQASMFKFDHVSRAAIGCALAEGLRGHTQDAERWLELVELAEETSKEVRVQIGPRRLTILGAAKRWADLAVAAKLLRNNEGANGMLQPTEAQLVAVLTLEAIHAGDVPRVAQDVVRQQSDQAISDLIRQGRVSAVLALAKRYGLGSLSGEGFIVSYIRGLLAYDKARVAHEASGEKSDEPTTRPEVANAYREAARALDAARADTDAARFKEERAGATFMTGLALYYAGELVAASGKLEEAANEAAGTPRAQEALWQSVVAIDRALEAGDGTLRAKRDQLAQLYIKSYPRGDRAARLLVRIKDSAGLDPEQAVRLLLSVERESPLFEAARREASGVLYRMVRASEGAAKDAAVLRYAEVAFSLLEADQRRAVQATGAERTQAAADAVNRARQMLDALLSLSSPDADRAARVFKMLDELHAAVGLDLSGVADELTYRRLEIAIARQDQPAIQTHLEALHKSGEGGAGGAGSKFSALADRRLYRDAARDWQRLPGDEAAARRVVDHGARVIKSLGSSPEVLANPSAAGVHATVAAAAMFVWSRTKDRTMLDLEGAIDKALLASTPATASLLRRHAQGSEARGETEAALDAWRHLLAGLPETDVGWFEARYESLRLLAIVDSAKARQALDQHKIMHPTLGPEPWGEKLRDLDQSVPAASPGTPLPTPVEAPR